jgi:hypothetical protein
MEDINMNKRIQNSSPALPPRRPPYIRRDNQEDDMQPRAFSSVTHAIGTMTETIAYNVTNGMNSANRTLWRLVVLVVAMAFIIGVLLTHMIEDWLSGK